MDETPTGGTVQEEPQEERGAVGSRDKGEGPAGGPTNRPAGKSDAEDSTSVGAQDPIDEEMPGLQSGDQGG